MTGIYQTVFNLINQYIFGSAVLDPTSYEHMVCVVGATIICCICVYAPFALARWFFRGFAR